MRQLDSIANNAYARIADSYTDQSDGVSVRTGSPTDVALQGPGWLALQDGTLRAASSHVVLCKSGPNVLPTDATVRVGDNGTMGQGL